MMANEAMMSAPITRHYKWHYCGAACQKVHWKAGHKQECRRLRESQSEGNA